MKTDLCAEDAVVRLTTPQMIAAESAGASGAGAARGASAAVECGRRLLLAARVGDTDTVRHLMAKGAPFTTDWLGTSPLHLAAANDHADTVGVLLRAGVSRDARTKVERTPLHVAASAGHARVVRALLDAGAAVDARDLLRMTPLHWAVERGHVQAAQALLRHGADPTAESKFRKTPLTLARDRPEMLRLIDDCLKEREATRSVNALVFERVKKEPSCPMETEIAHVHRIDDPSKMNKSKTTSSQKEKTNLKSEEVSSEASTATAAEGGGGGGAAALLRRHGITLLPTDDGSTVLSALQSGRTVVLSDAGKLMLKESGAARADAGVVVRATPVRAPPHGVKVFTLSSSAKLLRLPRHAEAAPAPAPAPAPAHAPVTAAPSRGQERTDLQQVKLVQLADEGGEEEAARAGEAGETRPAVRIIMNRQNFRKLIATATRASADAGGDIDPGDECGDGEAVVVVPEQFVRSSSAQYLRSQLLCAHAAIQHLAQQLRAARAQLAAPPRPEPAPPH